MTPEQRAGHHAWSILVGGIESLEKAWPLPRLLDVIRLAQNLPPAISERAAWEAREIVQAQDRAPNITALYKMKLEEALRFLEATG